MTDSHLSSFTGPPQFLVEPSDVEVSFGRKAYFTCKAEGNPEPEIVWYHNK